MVRLLEAGVIPFEQPGVHRRVTPAALLEPALENGEVTIDVVRREAGRMRRRAMTATELLTSLAPVAPNVATTGFQMLDHRGRPTRPRGPSSGG